MNESLAQKIIILTFLPGVTMKPKDYLMFPFLQQWTAFTYLMSLQRLKYYHYAF